MKTLNLEEGFPQVLADYPLLAEQNIKDGLAGLTGVFNNTKLSGLGLSIGGGNWTIAAGWVIFENEIMRVEEHVVNSVGGGDTVIAESYEVTILENPKPYLSGETKPLVKEKLCRFIKKTTEVTFVEFLFGMPQIDLRLANLALPLNNAWAAPGAGTYSLATGVTRDGDNPFYLTKSKDGQLRFKGSMSWDMSPGNISAGWRKILTVNDVDWRPDYSVRFAIPQGVTGATSGQEFGYLFELKPNGELWLKHETVGYTIGPINFGSINLNIF